MKHEKFPVAGFEFMDEPATEEQKDLIVKLFNEKGHPMKRNGKWPSIFSKWDAGKWMAHIRILPVRRKASK